MTLIVEDGTGLPDAVSYVAPAEADEYHAARGTAAWAAATAEAKAAALVRATDYADAAYAYAGKRATSTQALEWPRVGGGAPGGVPRALRHAVCELAVRALAGGLTPDGAPAVVEETIGPITTRYSERPAGRPYPHVDRLVRPLLAVRSGVAVVRGG